MAAARLVEPHALLRDWESQRLGGIVSKDDEWERGLDRKMPGTSHGAANVLAGLKWAGVRGPEA